MNYTIRKIQKQEYPLLDNFLYEGDFYSRGYRASAQNHYHISRIAGLC